MINSRKYLVIALLIPIIALAMLVANHEYRLRTGYEIILPISGYDPRDLLSGHYLIYRVEYGIDQLCYETNHSLSSAPSYPHLDKESYICMEPKYFSYARPDPYTRPDQCAVFIKGVCRYGQFVAGIEKFYIPESKAKELGSEVWDQKASIVLSISRDGIAQVKDLLINGHSWKENTGDGIAQVRPITH